jgi:hypothetical protein
MAAPAAALPAVAPPVEPGSFHRAQAEAKVASPNAMYLPRPTTGLNDPFNFAIGYKVYTDPTRANWASNHADFKRWGRNEIVILNNAFTDAKAAVTAAIADLAVLGAAAAAGPVPTPARARFERFFGTHSDTNRNFVLNNFKSIEKVLAGKPAPPAVAAAAAAPPAPPQGVAQLKKKFEQLAPAHVPAAVVAPPAAPVAVALPAGLAVIDATNDSDDFWRTCFGFTFRNRAPNNSVPFFVARAFFKRNTTIAVGAGAVDLRRALGIEAWVRGDATIVTIVHELAHACFWASDVPTVASGKVLDANGFPADNLTPCNDIGADETLAQTWPGLAILNADSYGQFAFAAWRNVVSAKFGIAPA